MNSKVTSKEKALGWVGVTWTKYHPEAEPQVPREKDPKYEWRTEKWKQIFVTNLYTDDDALELWHRKHNLSEEVPMEVDEMETLSKIDMEVDESILYVNCYNIQNFKDQWEVTIQEIPEGVIINDDQWSWLDIQKVQARFTQEPRGTQLPYHWKGPDYRCWHKCPLKTNEQCDKCISDLQAMTALSKLPDKTLTKWEKEKKIKPRHRLLPVQQKSPRFPTAYQTMKHIQASRCKESARIPKEIGEDYILYASEEVTAKGLEQIPTDVEIQILKDWTLILTPLEGEK